MKFVIFLAVILFIYPIKLNSQESEEEYGQMTVDLEQKYVNNDGRFMSALIKGDIRTLNEFVRYGYNIDKKYENGITPLVYAVYSGNSQVVRFLIKKGVDVNTSANSLMVNVMGIDFSEYTMAPILLATIKNDFNTVKMLLKAGAEVDKKDSNDRTSLIWATIIGYAPVLKILIKGGADINYTISTFTMGDTEYKDVYALFIACLRNDYDSAKILLKKSKFDGRKYLECLNVTIAPEIRKMLTKKLKKYSKVEELE